MVEEYTDKIIQGDCLEELRKMPDGIVQCIVTSPPYLSLRNYSDDPREIGREATWQDYVSKMVEVFRECKRVLKEDGIVWLNIGDGYFGKGKQTRGKQGNIRRPKADNNLVYGAPVYDPTKPDKCLIGLPWRLAFAMVDDGWVIRNAQIWIKMLAMPHSVKDRLANKYETIFLLTKKSTGYYFNLNNILEPPMNNSEKEVTSRTLHRESKKGKYQQQEKMRGSATRLYLGLAKWAAENAGSSIGVNPGDWRVIPPAQSEETHTAAFALELCTQPILASTRPGDIVMDPFSGTGTVAVAAKSLGRHYLGIELSTEHHESSIKRLAQDIMPFPHDEFAPPGEENDETQEEMEDRGVGQEEFVLEEEKREDLPKGGNEHSKPVVPAGITDDF